MKDEDGKKEELEVEKNLLEKEEKRKRKRIDMKHYIITC